MKLSVVICSRSSIPDRLKQDLKNQTLQPDEIIEIVGNALTTQRNEGVIKASGNLITFLDDDIELDSHYLEQIVNTFYTYPDASAVTGNIQVTIFKPNLLYTLFANIFLISCRGKGRFRISGFPESYHRDIITPIRAEVLCGCNMTIKKEVFNYLSFNENLEGGMFGEDDYFSYQLSRNYVIYYNPHAICYDDRKYPKGKQAWKMRCTILNTIQRYKERKTNLIGKIAFWWSMFGFILFKSIEAIIMKDFSIMKGIGNALWEILISMLYRK
jgi:glycosyltransferase involved in cell wall biosynthesis